MQLAKTTAFTAALLLSSTALVAQEAETRQLQSVFVDIGGSAVLVPMDVALDACALDESSLQTVAQTRLEESGIDQTQFYAGMDSFMGTTGATGAAGATSVDPAASADAGTAAATEGTGDTTMTADANATTDLGNETTDAGNSTDPAVADASGAGSADMTGAQATDTATADASGAAAGDANTQGMGVDDVQNVQTTAADTGAEAGSEMAAGTADPFLILATCQIDQARATELGIDTTQTATAAGFDAATLGIQSDVTDQ